MDIRYPVRGTRATALTSPRAAGTLLAMPVTKHGEAMDNHALLHEQKNLRKLKF